jgi:hypothetical protein
MPGMANNIDHLSDQAPMLISDSVSPLDRFLSTFSQIIWSIKPPEPIIRFIGFDVNSLCGDGFCSRNEVFEMEAVFGSTCAMDCQAFGRCSLPSTGPALNFTVQAMDFTQLPGIFGVRRSKDLPRVRILCTAEPCHTWLDILSLLLSVRSRCFLTSFLLAVLQHSPRLCCASAAHVITCTPLIQSACLQD